MAGRLHNFNDRISLDPAKTRYALEFWNGKLNWDSM